ncbi:uncharacterized protein LACBIDRAFT_313179 [Laccaria bicolor S238N-H82]|uniref:Predicted protein n=1 Tax=Laccaria bicolor (strain S238N-H82 / ATCC MYA-4686) TaxID=486041 RepID=B0DXQ4_LACBS|nr:uncharacterized protein LACBIDRAFT_313179 [Laccaria bicolor S238N-H82]EDR00656.1 predicted protein [Laccaria bicolor S238N-H82]|eukprot:XP_001888665.1 predicted protein [Laccaria bicolor S238N-H82]
MKLARLEKCYRAHVQRLHATDFFGDACTYLRESASVSCCFYSLTHSPKLYDSSTETLWQAGVYWYSCRGLPIYPI